MGRKGVSKRKPGKAKATPVVNDKASGSVSSVLQAADSKTSKSFDPGKSAENTDGSKKKNKKG